MNDTISYNSTEQHIKAENASLLGGLLSSELDLLFMKPYLLDKPSAWFGHIPFAHWLIGCCRPRLFVELGTHAGVSYTAFCAAVAKEHTDTECFAIDTWTGDDHAGKYDAQIYEDLKQFNDQHFNHFSTLIKSTFDDALDFFQDNSIDVLHIDGFHTYEAVSHDFKTWQPKLSNRAVVLFHDTNEYKNDFGVWRFWAELRSQYPAFEFSHSHGLGVLAIGENAPEPIKALCRLNSNAEAYVIRDRFKTIGDFWFREARAIDEKSQLAKSKAQNVEKAHAIKEAEQRIARLENERAQAITRVKETEQRVARLDSERAHAITRVKETEQRVARLDSEKAQAITRVKETEQRVARLENERAQAMARAKETEQRAARLDSERTQAMARAEEAEQRVARLESERTSILTSTSWRITKPLRMVGIHLPVKTRNRICRLARFVSKPFRLFSLIRELRAYQTLTSTPMFDRNWYLSEYPDVAAAGSNPVLHYLLHGANEGRNPSKQFDTQFYFNSYPDVLAAGVNPLYHYIIAGQAEGRYASMDELVYETLKKSPLFDREWYLAEYPDVAATGQDPVRHYIQKGASEGKNPSTEFDTRFYLNHYPKVRNAGINPLYHFIKYGKHQGWQPRPHSNKQRIAASLEHDTTSIGEIKLKLSVARRIADLEQYKQRIAEYGLARLSRSDSSAFAMKIAVYTAIADNYDSIKLPEQLNPQFDYVLFSDKPFPDTGVWQVRPITYSHADSTRTCRYVKTHPHHLLPEYDVVIWLDSSLLIVGDIKPALDAFLDSHKAVAAVPHPFRKNVFDEAAACQRGKRDEIDIIHQQIEHYRNAGFEHDDLIESGWLMFDMKQECTKLFLDTWWREIDRYSKRDQLSINYALKEAGIDWHRLTEWPNSARNHPELAFVLHDSAQGAAQILLDALRCPTIDPYVGPSYAMVREQAIAKQGARRINIVVCVHNALDDVKRCLSSIKAARKNENHQLIIIDDGSENPTAKYLEEFSNSVEWAELHRNTEALGYTKAANQGINASTAELVILLNSDTIVTDSWAEKMADAVFSTPGAGIVGPMSNAASHQSIPEHHSSANQTAINELPPNLTPEDMNRFCEQWTTAHILPRVPLVHGFCFGVTRAVIDKIGLLDEISFPRGYGEENDYCFRATDAGFGLVVATHTYVFHSKSKSYEESARILLMKASAQTLNGIHGAYRVRNAVKLMQNNIFLERHRKFAKSIVDSYKNEFEADGITPKALAGTSTEPESIEGNISNLNVVRNKQLIDWNQLIKEMPERNSDLVSIVMCVYGQIELTEKCLASLFAHEAGEGFELILVDNGNTTEIYEKLESWAKRYSSIKLIKNPENYNFALGNNIGFAASIGSRVVFLNSDTEVSAGWLKALVSPLDNPDIKGTQPKLLYPDGTIQGVGVVFSKYSPLGYPIYLKQRGDFVPAMRSRNFAAVTAACVAMRAEDFARAYGFDPVYINGQEDIDLCLRIGRGNPVFRYVADSVIVHHESKSPGRGKNIEANRRVFCNRWKEFIQADDFRYYEEDDMKVDNYIADNPSWIKPGYAVWRPQSIKPERFSH